MCSLVLVLHLRCPIDFIWDSCLLFPVGDPDERPSHLDAEQTPVVSRVPELLRAKGHVDSRDCSVHVLDGPLGDDGSAVTPCRSAFDSMIGHRNNNAMMHYVIHEIIGLQQIRL